MDDDCPNRQLQFLAGRMPHPNSPAGQYFDWWSSDVPHPLSPAGRYFDWPSLDIPHPGSPAGRCFDWSSLAVREVASVDLDPAIESLDLAPAAKKAAYQLKRKFPSITFTSGRRGTADQARAMAGNVVSNRKWIEQTYKKSAVRDACQKWVDDHKDKKTKDEIAAGLKSVFDSLPQQDVARISKHLSGEAFDVQPVKHDAAKIKKAIRNLPGVTKFLEKEGGLVRWHVQF